MQIGLVGTFDVENYGDCLFPEIWQRVLSRHSGAFQTRLFSPTSTPASILTGDRVESLPATIGDASNWFEACDLDAVILAGGETIGAGHGAGTYIFPVRSMSHYLRLWLGPLIGSASSVSGGPFLAHAIGLTQNDRWDELIVPCIEHAVCVTARDSSSARRLNANSTPSVDTVVDPVFSIGRLFPELKEVDDPAVRLIRSELGSRYFMAHVSPGYAAGRLDRWCEAVSEMSRISGLPVALTPVCDFLGDVIVLEWAARVIRNGGIRCMVVPGRRNVKSTAAVIAQADAVVTSSLHAAVTAVSFGVKVAVLASRSGGKHRGTLDTVGLGGSVATDITALPGHFEDALSLDVDRAATEGADMALRDLSEMISLLRSPGARIKNVPLLMRSAEEIVAGERSAALADRRLLLQRLISKNMRHIPRLNDFYRRRRLKSMLPKR